MNDKTTAVAGQCCLGNPCPHYTVCPYQPSANSTMNDKTIKPLSAEWAQCVLNAEGINTRSLPTRRIIWAIASIASGAHAVYDTATHELHPKGTAERLAQYEAALRRLEDGARDIAGGAFLNWRALLQLKCGAG